MLSEIIDEIYAVCGIKGVCVKNGSSVDICIAFVFIRSLNMSFKKQMNFSYFQHIQLAKTRYTYYELWF